MNCQHEHIDFQPTNEEFVCPACGAGIGDFCVSESVNEDDSCKLLHKGDWVECYKCGVCWPVDTYAQLMKAKVNNVVCPTCDGSGIVTKDKVLEMEGAIKKLNEYILELENKLIEANK